jgi:hypothetical protein
MGRLLLSPKTVMVANHRALWAQAMPYYQMGETHIMEFNKNRVDDYTLALLFLVMHDEGEHGARAWKGFDWDTMNRLHEKGFIGNPVGKAKSVAVTPQGCKRARELFEAYFAAEE